MLAVAIAARFLSIAPVLAEDPAAPAGKSGAYLFTVE